MDSSKPTVLFGPEPSKNYKKSGAWQWFGMDLANELKKYYNIITQTTKEKIKKADCYVVIKNMGFVKTLQSKKNVIFIAVDALHCEEEVKLCGKYPATITILNNEQLYLDYFKNTKNNHYAMFIPHHTKYFIDDYTYNPDQHITWIGVRGNVKYLVQYLKEHKVDRCLRILTSDKFRNPNVIYTPNTFLLPKNSEIISWTDQRHYIALGGCSGFLDVKGSDFHQRYKPATKVLDALASGVPTAINDCGVRRYMESLGIELAYPTDTEKWFSRDYYDYTQGLKWRIREEFNVEKIALQYKEVIDQVLSNV